MNEPGYKRKILIKRIPSFINDWLGDIPLKLITLFLWLIAGRYLFYLYNMTSYGKNPIPYVHDWELDSFRFHNQYISISTIAGWGQALMFISGLCLIYILWSWNKKSTHFFSMFKFWAPFHIIGSSIYSTCITLSNKHYKFHDTFEGYSVTPNITSDFYGEFISRAIIIFLYCFSIYRYLKKYNTKHNIFNYTKDDYDYIFFRNSILFFSIIGVFFYLIGVFIYLFT